jgi:hypothetical protein
MLKFIFPSESGTPDWPLAGMYNWPIVPTELFWMFTNIFNLYSDPFSTLLACIWEMVGSTVNLHRLS